MRKKSSLFLPVRLCPRFLEEVAAGVVHMHGVKSLTLLDPGALPVPRAYGYQAVADITPMRLAPDALDVRADARPTHRCFLRRLARMTHTTSKCPMTQPRSAVAADTAASVFIGSKARLA